jgi:hypothetical protein
MYDANKDLNALKEYRSAVMNEIAMWTKQYQKVYWHKVYVLKRPAYILNVLQRWYHQSLNWKLNSKRSRSRLKKLGR